MIFLLAATATFARAQTGRDLLGVCISKDPIQQTSCTLYISGFVHGLQAAEDLKDEICIPKGTTGNDAKSIFIETLAYAELAAALNMGPGSDAGKFFTGAQNAALASALAMKFRCPHRGERKTRLRK
jgi:Rap1a immunity proteins